MANKTVKRPEKREKPNEQLRREQNEPLAKTAKRWTPAVPSFRRYLP